VWHLVLVFVFYAKHHISLRQLKGDDDVS
jgi:hypothetical protein